MNNQTEFSTLITGSLEEYGEPLCRYEIRINGNEAHINSFIPLSYCYSDDDGADMLEIILEMLTDLCVHTVYFEPVNYDFLPMLLGFGFEFNHPFYDSMYLDLY